MLNDYVSKLNETLDEDHDIISQLSDYIKRRNIDYKENEYELSHLDMQGKDEHTRVRLYMDVYTKFRRIESNFQQIEEKLKDAVEEHFTKYKKLIHTKLALFILQQHMSSYLTDKIAEKKTEVRQYELSKDLVSKVKYLNESLSSQPLARIKSEPTLKQTH